MIGRAGPAALLVLALLAGCAPARPRAVDPLSADEHNTLGLAYYARGEHARALAEFERALVLRPGFTRAQVNAGDARLALGQLDGAIAAYERAHAASPEDPAIANNLAWALLQHERRWPEAEPLIAGALDRHPEPRGYYLDTLGLLLLRKGEAERALDAFRSALRDPAIRDPAVRSLVLHHVAAALARLGERAAAEQCDEAARRVAASPPAVPSGPTGPTEPTVPTVPTAPTVKVGDGDTVC